MPLRAHRPRLMGPRGRAHGHKGPKGPRLPRGDPRAQGTRGGPVGPRDPRGAIVPRFAKRDTARHADTAFQIKMLLRSAETCDWPMGPWPMGPWAPDAHAIVKDGWQRPICIKYRCSVATGPRAHVPMCPWAHGFMGGFMGPRSHGPIGPWAHEPVGPRVDPWAHVGRRALGPRAHGPMCPCAPGLTGSWAHGAMGP